MGPWARRRLATSTPVPTPRRDSGCRRRAPAHPHKKKKNRNADSTSLHARHHVLMLSCYQLRFLSTGIAAFCAACSCHSARSLCCSAIFLWRAASSSSRWPGGRWCSLKRLKSSVSVSLSASLSLCRSPWLRCCCGGGARRFRGAKSLSSGSLPGAKSAKPPPKLRRKSASEREMVAAQRRWRRW